jgi:hypothetical protein
MKADDKVTRHKDNFSAWLPGIEFLRGCRRGLNCRPMWTWCADSDVVHDIANLASLRGKNLLESKCGFTGSAYVSVAETE